MIERMKCCQNCIRSSSSTVSTIFCYYCSAYRRYVNPTDHCPLYVPAEGYEIKGDANE